MTTRTRTFNICATNAQRPDYSRSSGTANGTNRESDDDEDTGAIVSRRRKPKALHLSTVPPQARHQRTMADEVQVEFPPIQWTPELIADLAHLLANALVRDLQPRKAS
ncbi:MAG: hypothetical protein KF747_15450 [Nitrospira sp.]|nr:hypothetical protein [Nitrospira sp.]